MENAESEYLAQWKSTPFSAYNGLVGEKKAGNLGTNNFSLSKKDGWMDFAFRIDLVSGEISHTKSESVFTFVPHP